MLAFVRDIIEATSQRWDRYVVGYDLRQQVYLFETISRYGSRHASPLLARFRPSPSGCDRRRSLRHRLRHLATSRRNARPPPDLPKIRGHASDMLATALYELLESAMSAKGIPRGASTPPLRHAESFEQLGHPLADDVSI